MFVALQFSIVSQHIDIKLLCLFPLQFSDAVMYAGDLLLSLLFSERVRGTLTPLLH